MGVTRMSPFRIEQTVVIVGSVLPEFEHPATAGGVGRVAQGLGYLHRSRRLGEMVIESGRHGALDVGLLA